MKELTVEVEAKRREYRRLVDEMWDRRGVEEALAGEKLLGAVEESMDDTKRLRLLVEELERGKLFALGCGGDS